MIFNTKTGMIASGTVGTVNAPKETQSGKRYVTFSIAAAYENGATTWVNCKAWGRLVDAVICLQKGDCAIVTGRVEEREYNGKQYKDLVADCVCVSHVGVPADGFTPAAVPPEFADEDLPPMEGELPF